MCHLYHFDYCAYLPSTTGVSSHGRPRPAPLCDQPMTHRLRRKLLLTHNAIYTHYMRVWTYVYYPSVHRKRCVIQHWMWGYSNKWNGVVSLRCVVESRGFVLEKRNASSRARNYYNRCSNKLVNIFIIIFVRFEQFYTTDCFCVVNMTVSFIAKLHNIISWSMCRRHAKVKYLSYGIISGYNSAPLTNGSAGSPLGRTAGSPPVSGATGAGPSPMAALMSVADTLPPGSPRSAGGSPPQATQQRSNSRSSQHSPNSSGKVSRSYFVYRWIIAL